MSFETEFIPRITPSPTRTFPSNWGVTNSHCVWHLVNLRAPDLLSWTISCGALPDDEQLKRQDPPARRPGTCPDNWRGLPRSLGRRDEQLADEHAFSAFPLLPSSEGFRDHMTNELIHQLRSMTFFCRQGQMPFFPYLIL